MINYSNFFLFFLLLGSFGNSSTIQLPKKNVLVLGATGFVGQRICSRLSQNNDINIVGLSRRGTPDIDSSNGKVKYLSCDVGDEDALRSVCEDFGPKWDTIIHCCGLLFESEVNKFVSGSGSIPTPGVSTYDRVTRQTAFNAINVLESMKSIEDNSDDGEKRKINENKPTFIFVSAAEAGWEFEAPVEFLERYLIAKRAVESKLIESSSIREVIVRPSLIYTLERPQALLSVIPFTIANAIGIPFVDKPVQVDDLVETMYQSIFDENIQGILRYKRIEEISGSNGCIASSASSKSSSGNQDQRMKKKN